MKKYISLLLAIVLTLSLAVIPAGATEVANVAAESRHGVVRVIAIGRVTSTTIEYGSGSGFAVGETGEHSDIFITNQHVVEGGNSIYIALDNDWQRSVPEFGGKADNVHAVKCEIVYVTNGEPDFAILRAERVIKERVAMPLMYSHQATPGDTIFVLGYPGVADHIEDNVSADIDAISITRGTISRFTNMDATNSKAIQIDADVNEGNSGGPLITEDGVVIGINTWYWAEGNAKICLSLEIDYVIEKLTELRKDGTLDNFRFTVLKEPPKADTAQAPEDKDEDREEDEEDEKESASATPLILAAAGVVIIILLLVVLLAKRRSSKTSGGSGRGDNTPVVRREFRLVGTEGFFAGKRIALDHELKLGRNPNNDLDFPTDTPGISGTHCLLTPREDCVLLTDLGSTYGTYLANGTRLTPHQSVRLQTGDRFYLADTRQSFAIDHKR